MRLGIKIIARKYASSLFSGIFAPECRLCRAQSAAAPSRPPTSPRTSTDVLMVCAYPVLQARAIIHAESESAGLKHATRDDDDEPIVMAAPKRSRIEPIIIDNDEALARQFQDEEDKLAVQAVSKEEKKKKSMIHYR